MNIGIASIGAWTTDGRYNFLVAERRSDTRRRPMVCFSQQSKYYFRGKNLQSTMHAKVICCKLYISECQNAKVVDEISRICREDPEVVLLNIFGDEYYERVRYTLVSYIISDHSTGEVFSPIREVLFAMIKNAFSVINLEKHCGAHPRIGVVDDISFHPLSQAATMEDAAKLAKLVAYDIGNGLKVPVFLYGAEHPEGKIASEVRRMLRYDKPNRKDSQWEYQVLPDTLPVTPDEGPTHVSRERGATMVGAMPFVKGYNVPILCNKDAKAVVARITEEVRERERHEGLPIVQAPPLRHGNNCMEIACLLHPDHVSPDKVQSLVERLAEKQGLKVKKGYSADLSKDEMLQRVSAESFAVAFITMMIVFRCELNEKIDAEASTTVADNGTIATTKKPPKDPSSSTWEKGTPTG